MRLISHLIIVAVFLIGIAQTVIAQYVDSDIKTQTQLRSYYQEISYYWPPIPPQVQAAFLAAEDPAFVERPAHRTQLAAQVAYFLTLGHNRAERHAYSQLIGRTLSHDEILNWYLNGIFLGHSCFGVTGAAWTYYGKHIDELSLEETAYLAAIPKAPALFHPVRSYDRAIKRRNFVLRRMLEIGSISQGQATKALESSLIVQEPLGECLED